MKHLKLIIIIFICWQDADILFAQVNISYYYDNLQRLTSISYGDGRQIIYTYDDLGNRQSMIIIVPCENPDLIISNISVTRYTPEKIYYTFQIKNQGTAYANLSSFAFAGFNNSNPQRDGNEEFRYAFFTGGGLAPNTTMNLNFSSGFSFNSNKYYLILTADYYNSVIECVETNNDLATLVNPCTSSGSLSITGSLSNKLLSSNGAVSISNASLSNVLVVGKSITESPNVSMTNSSVVLGGCLNGPYVGSPTLNQERNSIKDSANFVQSPISEMKLSNDSILSFKLSSPQKLTLRIYGDTERKLLKTVVETKEYRSGVNEITIDATEWIKGQKFSLHLSSDKYTEVLVFE